MNSSSSTKTSPALLQAIEELGFEKPTPIQQQSYPVILSGSDMVGIAQTGTGKTWAYLLPILDQLKYSDQLSPRILILVPTRELVLQIVELINQHLLTKSIRVLGVYGGTNIHTQKEKLVEGCDILVATPGRLFDLAVSLAVKLRSVNKLVIDEVDIMLDLGFRHQLNSIFELMKDKRQNIMFSATMTEEVDALINDYFIRPKRIAIALSGTPLHNISQHCYAVKNFNTKINLLNHLLQDKQEFEKVLVFASTKKHADRIYESLEENYGPEMGVMHANKSQNFRIKAIESFEQGDLRVMIATDLMARGLDLEEITHVINFDTPSYPENYMHRIGRTGRAEKKGNSLLFFTEKEEKAKGGIEELMAFKIPQIDFPESVQVSAELIADERPNMQENYVRKTKLKNTGGGAFHEKSEKNKKTNQGGSYLRKKKTYKKPKTRGDKKQKPGNRRR